MGEKTSQLTPLKKLLYGSGEAVSVISVTSIGLFFMYYLTDIVGISPAIAGTVFLVGRAWDAIIDPIIGITSDRTHTRFGRRRPFFLTASIFLVIFSGLLWNKVDWGNLTMLYYSIVYIAVATAVSSYHVPYLSLITELSDDYNERTSVSNYRIACQLIFGLVAAVIPKLISDAFNQPAVGYQVMGIGIGVFIGIMALLMFFFSKERVIIKEVSKLNVKNELVTLFKNKPMRYLLLIYVGCYAAANVIEGFVIYYMKYWLNREADMSILLVVVILTGVLSLPAWTWVSRKLGKKRTIFIGLLLWAVAQGTWVLVAPSSNPLIIYFVGAFAGIGYGVAHVLPWAMLPDVLDVDELNTGRRREGLYSGVMTFFMQLSNSIAIFIIGIILEVSGYIPNVVQTPGALNTIKWTMALAPGFFVVLGLITTLFYPYSKEEHLEFRKTLDEKQKKIA